MKLTSATLRAIIKEELEEVVDFFGRFRAEIALFGTAGVGEDGRLLEFHESEVRASERMRANAQRSLLVIDHSKFGRLAPAAGARITDVDQIVCDRPPTAKFNPILEALGEQLMFAEKTQ